MTSPNKKTSVFFFGIDGADWSFLKEWIESGDLPTLKKIYDAGASGSLQSVVPTLSCTNWPSVYTGVNPGKHGIYEYLDSTGNLINSTLIKSEKIWSILSGNNKRCCVINVPVTYPLEKINGYMISSFLTPLSEKNFCHPKKLQELADKHGYKINIKADQFIGLPDKQEVFQKRFEILDELYDVTAKRYQTLKEIVAESWDFFMIVLTETSTLHYLFWDRKDVIRDFYKKIDSYLGGLLAIFENKNPNPYIFIASDHGYHTAPRYSVNIRAWLTDAGFLKDSRTLIQKIVPKIYRPLAKLPFIKIMSSWKAKHAREKFHLNIITGGAVYFKSPGIYIKKNAMSPQEYEHLRERMIAQLKSVISPFTKQCPFLIVEKREAIFSGPQTAQAPDIILLSKEQHSIIFSYDSDEVFKEINLYLPGRHHAALQGIFICAGEHIFPQKKTNISIMDLFPTMLHIYDLPIPSETDGKVAKELFEKESVLAQREVVFLTSHFSKQSEEQKKIEAVLEDISL